ncbi:MAG: SurA N-terminal domain-containing protein [Puniceicoccales bacterium]
MFTWLQIHIQKHHKIVFGVLLVLIIIAFVFTIGNFGGFGGSGNPQAQKREFYGFNLNSQRDVSALRNWTIITFALDGRRLNEDQLSIGVQQRAVSLYLAEQLQIPGPTQKQFDEYVASRPAFQNPQTGRFDQNTYTMFLDSFQNNPQMGEETLVTALSQNFRIEQVRRAIGGPGYVLPYQAVEEIKMRETVWSVDIAELNREDYNPEIAVTDEALATYYNENKARYETAPRYITEFIEIDADAYTDQVADPSPAQITAHYNRNRAKWSKNEEGQTKPLDDIRDEVSQSYKKQEATKLATDEANKLAVQIYDASYEGQWSFGDGSVEEFLVKQGYEPQPLPPLAQGAIPTDAALPQNALKQALTLNKDRFYSDGLPTDDGAALIILKEITGTTIPPLEEVRERVVADYQRDEKGRQFNLHTEGLQKQLNEAVAAGKSFADTAKELGMTVETFTDFTFMSRPEGIDNWELSALLDMSQGEVSNLVGFGDLGTIMYVSKKDVPDVDPESEEVQAQVERLAQYTAQATEAGVLNELIAQGDKSLEMAQQ